MKKTKTRVVYAALKEYENGATMEYLAQKYGITQGTISKWKKKYGTISENIPCSNENIPCLDENIPCLDENIPCSNENIPCLDENIPCSNENIPCSNENIPCEKYYPDWFPEELKGQNVIDIEYDLWMKYAEKLPYDKVLETPWIAFYKKYGQYMQKDHPNENKTESMKDYMREYRLSKKSLDNPGNLECPDKM